MLLKKMDEVLGLDLFGDVGVDVPDDVRELVDEREVARTNRDWERADELRRKVYKWGFVLEDKKKGVIVKKR